MSSLYETAHGIFTRMLGSLSKLLGVPIGKIDCLSHVGGAIRQKTA